MLSTQTRLKVQFLCARIEAGEPVELSDMQWLQKHANANRTVHDMVNRARRRAMRDEPAANGSLDAFLDDMNLGSPDPSSHLTGDSTVDDIAAFFKAEGWLQRD